MTEESNKRPRVFWKWEGPLAAHSKVKKGGKFYHFTLSRPAGGLNWSCIIDETVLGDFAESEVISDMQHQIEASAQALCKNYLATV